MEKDFNIKFAKIHSLSIFLGQRASGKSTLMKNIVMNSIKNNLFDKYYLSLPSFRGDKTVQPLGKLKVNIMEGFSDVVLDDIQKSPKERKLLVVDDATGLFSQGNSTDGRRLINSVMRLRHFNCSIIIILHSMTSSVPTSVKENVDYYFITRMNNRVILKDIWEQSFSLNMSLNDFLDIFRNKENKFECYALDPMLGAIDKTVKDWQLFRPTTV